MLNLGVLPAPHPRLCDMRHHSIPRVCPPTERCRWLLLFPGYLGWLLNLYAMPDENSVEILRLLPMLSLSHDIRVKSGRKENGACLG
ncbi:hypothetical protein VTJ04DRAFT_2192 [Mycothermus thermophilus]|uniref:uncharacterized protein n=1 Tax=Humicola insolens TaxID=85995 RepID=UPI003743BE5B